MEKIQELYVILEDRPGTAGEMFRVLKKKQISVYAVGVFIDAARIYVSDTEKALEALRENGYEVDVREVLKVTLPNHRGALMELTMKLGNAGINIKYLFGALEPKQKRGTVVLEVDDPDLALDIFRNHQF